MNNIMHYILIKNGISYYILYYHPAIDCYDPINGLPTFPLNGDRYISKETANGWIKNYMYEWKSKLSKWTCITPLANLEVNIRSGSNSYNTIASFDGSNWKYVRSWNTDNYTHQNIYNAIINSRFIT